MLGINIESIYWQKRHGW